MSTYTVTNPEDGARQSVASVYCIGRNYAEHASELNNPVPGEPVVFLKTAAALRPMTSGGVAFPDETFHHEAELVLLVTRGVALGARAGWEAVGGIALGLDLTRREVQGRLKEKGLPWTVSKSFAGSGVLTEFLPLKRFADPDRITFTLDVNGERRQTGDSREMLFKVPVLLTYLARLNPLVPGDLVYTGTPKGVGPVKVGDKLRLEFTESKVGFDGAL